MKVANITLHAINNYGSVLQALATERIFQDLGCEVETVNYIRETAQGGSLWKIIKYGGPGWKIKCKQIVLYFLPSNNKRADVLEDFRNKYLHLSKKQYRSDKDLEQDPPIADIYCTGSDQTWNTVCQSGVPKAFFLHFAPKGKKKIAFSASFGIEELPQKDIAQVKDLLSEYSTITIREESGINILKKLGYQNAHQVLDPTLAVDPKLWHDLAAARQYEGDYIFVYQLNSNSRFTDYVNSFSAQKKLPVIYIRARVDNNIRNGIYKGEVSPEVFLSLFKYSKYVITDSFHATAFSTIFHCNFGVMYPPFFSTRLESMLKLINHLDRKIISNDCSMFERSINYEEIDSIINKERTKVNVIIQKALMQ